MIAETATIPERAGAREPERLDRGRLRDLVREVATAPDGADGIATVTLAAREQRIFPDAYALLRAAGVATGAERAGHVGSLRITVLGAPIDQVFAAARTGFRGPEGGSFGLFIRRHAGRGGRPGGRAPRALSADAENRSNVALVHTGPDGSGSIALEVRTYDGENGGVEQGLRAAADSPAGPAHPVQLDSRERRNPQRGVRVRRVGARLPGSRTAS